MLIFILAELKEEPPGDPGPGPRKAMFLERPKSAEVWVHDERAQWCRVGSMLGHPSAWTMARDHRRPTSSYSQVSLLKGSETIWSRRAKPDWVAAGACGARPYPPLPVEELDPLCSRCLRIREPKVLRTLCASCPEPTLRRSAQLYTPGFLSCGRMQGSEGLRQRHNP